MGVSTSARRRDPVQERSQETVGRVLAGAGRLLARGVPPNGLTTAQIATEAGLSVGALYRFFPDKQAVVDAIALRHLEAFQEGVATRLMLALPDSPAGLLGAVLDSFAAYLEANPDFRTLAYGPPGGGGRAISSALFEAQSGAGELAGMVREVLAEMYDLRTGGEDFAFRLRIAIEIGDRLLAHAFTQEGAARVRVLDEAKAILSGYLLGAMA